MTTNQYIHLSVKFPAISPLIPTTSIGFNYFSPTGNALGNDVADLATHVTNSLSILPTGATNKPCDYISAVMSRAANAGTVEAYDVSNNLDGTPHGSPVAIGSFTLGPVTGGLGSAEGLAAVITLQAPYGLDVEFAPGARPRARDRGRIYWGPLASGNCTSTDVNNRVYLIPQCRTDLTAWIHSINTYTTTPSSVVYDLAVWSRKNKMMKALSEVWIDDRVDYRRKRAGKAGAKTVVTLP
jgi:hypothetical protein